MVDKQQEDISERFVFRGYKDEFRERLKDLLKEYSLDFNDAKIDLLIKLLEQISESDIKNYIMELDDHVITDIEFPEKRNSHSLSLLIPRTRYFINIRRTLIAIIAFLIDFFATKGATTLTLTLLGQINKVVYKLNDEELMVLNIVKELEKDKECVALHEVIEKLTIHDKLMTREKVERIIEKLRNNDIITLTKEKCLKITL